MTRVRISRHDDELMNNQLAKGQIDYSYTIKKSLRLLNKTKKYQPKIKLTNYMSTKNQINENKKLKQCLPIREKWQCIRSNKSNIKQYTKKAVLNKHLETEENFKDLIDYLEDDQIVYQTLKKTREESFKDFLDYLEIKPIKIDSTINELSTEHQINYDCKSYTNLPKIKMTHVMGRTSENKNSEQIYDLHSKIDLGIVKLEY